MKAQRRGTGSIAPRASFALPVVLMIAAVSPAAATTATQAGGVELPTIAVIAFTNLRPDPETDWIGEGAAETVTTKLAGLSSLVVTERGQVRQVVLEQDFQRSDLSEPATAARAGRLLGAQRVVVGTYAPQGDRVMFNIRVVDVESGLVLNTAAHTGPISTIFDTLYQLAEAVIASFEKKVVVVDSRPEVRPAPPQEHLSVPIEERRILREECRTTPQAFESYSRGLLAVSYAEREKYFSLAIQQDSSFAWAYYQRGQTRASRSQFQLAIGDFEQATRTHPGCYDAWYAQAVTHERLGDPVKARVSYQRFCETAPPSKADKVEKALKVLGKAGQAIKTKIKNKIQRKRNNP
ncbi:MAG TPA: FlgO family outer membrane protein [Phycisphaerae bacterium]|nr:FlgO family outer membrane protein [Phycisphaerae bacterium]